MNEIETIKSKYILIKGQLNERSRRIWAASEAIALGHGGISIVSQATDLALSTIGIGKKELLMSMSGLEPLDNKRMRRKGGGRKRLEDKNTTLLEELNKLVEPGTRGDPESPLRWTTKSTRNLASALQEKGLKISHVKVAELLSEQGYSLQSLRKTNEGNSSPDRDAQFNYINNQTIDFHNKGLPVISVDAKKKELIGSFKNGGQEYQIVNSPEEVNVYDFPSLAEGKATPYGVYDLSKNTGWVNVGISRDTAQFAVNSIRNWWAEMGAELYDKGSKILIHADSGGSNSSRSRLWKMELQKFANDTGLEITVSHFPPGTSKWNKIEHRLFSQITKNWRGRALESLEVIVNLISSTKTSTGLTVRAQSDENIYEKGLKISKEDFKSINIQKHVFHGDDWNYTIMPLSR